MLLSKILIIFAIKNKKLSYHNQYKTWFIAVNMGSSGISLNLEGKLSKSKLARLVRYKDPIRLSFLYESQGKKGKTSVLLEYNPKQKCTLVSNLNAENLYGKNLKGLHIKIGPDFYYTIQDGGKFSAKIRNSLENFNFGEIRVFISRKKVKFASRDKLGV